jgi:2-polyprenyl-6-methoxyphenol hydroxylase-like FAD-dependent oxidoreductase
MHDIVIIGGGIGGMTSAIALRQRGLLAPVYEAAPELRAVGAGIALPPNAMQVFGRLGLAEAVQQAGMALGSAEIRDFRGDLLQRVDISAASQRYGFPTVAIHRARLQGVLAAALEPSQLHLGKACVAILEEHNGVRVRFADGDEVIARAAVGADGLRSAVRQQLFPDVTLRYSGQSSYRAIGAIALPAGFAGVGWEVWGPGCRFGFSAVAPSEVYWFATLDASPGALRGREHVKPWLTELFAAFPLPCAAIIDATREADILNTDIYDIRPLPHWHQGRVGLLGDAAHATTPNLGQGGAQAIEDADMLAICLAAHHDPVEAFGAYEQRRHTKAAMVVNRSWQLGKLAHLRNPLARTVRNLLVRSTPESVVQRQFDALFRLDDAAPGRANNVTSV